MATYGITIQGGFLSRYRWASESDFEITIHCFTWEIKHFKLVAELEITMTIYLWRTKSHSIVNPRDQ